MKTQNEHLENIQCVTDDTDHFWFACPVCDNKKPMEVCSAWVKNGTAYFLLQCPICKRQGHRKVCHIPMENFHITPNDFQK